LHAEQVHGIAEHDAVEVRAMRRRHDQRAAFGHALELLDGPLNLEVLAQAVAHGAERANRLRAGRREQQRQPRRDDVGRKPIHALVEVARDLFCEVSSKLVQQGAQIARGSLPQLSLNALVEGELRTSRRIAGLAIESAALVVERVVDDTLQVAVLRRHRVLDVMVDDAAGGFDLCAVAVLGTHAVSVICTRRGRLRCLGRSTG
jgi:hypothetical protein